MSDTGTKKRFSLGNTDKERRNNLIVIFLSVILVVVIVLFFLQRSETQQIVQSLNIQKDSLEVELNSMIMSYDSLSTDNDTLNAELFAAQTKVKNLLIEVEQIKKASYEEITGYQNEVNSLRSIMRNFVVQVDSLNQRNQELMAENEEVKQQYSVIESQNQNLTRQNSQLEQRVERAAMLEALDLTVEGINDKGKDVNNSDKAVQLKVNFTLSKNVTARRGAKNIYVRIQRPDQILLVKSSNDLFQFEDLRIPYSAVREVTYEGNELPVSIYWDNAGEDPFMTGEYIIDIFADGNNIGETTFSFKK